MARSVKPEPVGGDQSLGDLVALAAKDVSQLIRYEIDLAKTELKADAQRVGIAPGRDRDGRLPRLPGAGHARLRPGVRPDRARHLAWAAFLIIAGLSCCWR